MSDDLVAFLRARLDEDEQVARAATSGRWRWDLDGGAYEDDPLGTATQEWGSRGPDLMSGDEPVIGATGYDASNVIVKRADANHIARHDPARVLAEVEAKRRIIELHRATDGLDCASCANWGDVTHDRDYGEMGSHEWYPCSTLRFLTLPYAGYPDYQDAWR